MKTLRDYKLRVEEPATISNRISWGAAFPIPIHGTVNGMPARALIAGDLPGASTVLLCSDPTGFLNEVKRADFIVTDGAYLPLLDTQTRSAAPTLNTTTPHTVRRRGRPSRAKTATAATT